MIKIEITKSGLATIGKRGFREVGRLAIAAAGEYWKETYLPLHFTNIAYIRYRFARRDKRTKKLKAAGAPWPFGENTAPAIRENKPLVFTGRSRQRSQSARVTAKAKNYQAYNADVVIDAPAFNFGVGKRIDMRDEVTRYTPQEETTMERIFAKEWERQLIKRGAQAPKKTRRAKAA